MRECFLDHNLVGFVFSRISRSSSVLKESKNMKENEI